ncbi:Integrase, catalytic core [Gossypium australe]|uniref:Integrase, catalytic core n=1 Tax=Gossypium australe TaxID=47621 RepID=A0A5B6VNL9_9ROSI|nr:Integrase, catalytic core [Gossypium australe]
MPLQTILEVELFDGNAYILLAIDYVSKWVEVIALPTNDAKSVLKFLHKNSFTRYGTHCALNSDEGSHFDCKSVANALNRYRAEVSNREIKQILEKVVNPNRKDWSFRLDEALWAYRTAFKTPLGMSPFKLVYGKHYHFPIELEQKKYSIIKKLNIDWSVAGTNCLLELN